MVLWYALDPMDQGRYKWQAPVNMVMKFKIS